MKRILILSLLLCSSAGHAAGIKKWVDDSGQVHYGDRPPAKTKSESVRISRPPSNPGRPLPRLGGQGSTPGDDSNGGGSTGNGKSGDAPQYSDDEKQKICARAKKDLVTLTTNDNIRLRSGDGKSRIMSSTEKKARMDQAQSDIDQFCN